MQHSRSPEEKRLLDYDVYNHAAGLKKLLSIQICIVDAEGKCLMGGQSACQMLPVPM